MKKISSRYLFFLKKIFPLLWFGYLVSFYTVGFINGRFEKDPTVLVVSGFWAVLSSALIFFFIKIFTRNVVDEVYDCGDSLLIKSGGIEERVALANIMNVSIPIPLQYPRITLRLVKPGKLGSEISFFPVTPFTINPFAKDPVSEDLIVRIDQARVKRAL